MATTRYIVKHTETGDQWNETTARVAEAYARHPNFRVTAETLGDA
jgi:hypothetical protein